MFTNLQINPVTKITTRGGKTAAITGGLIPVSPQVLKKASGVFQTLMFHGQKFYQRGKGGFKYIIKTIAALDLPSPPRP